VTDILLLEIMYLMTSRPAQIRHDAKFQRAAEIVSLSVMPSELFGLKSMVNLDPVGKQRGLS
jgi:hypothetical protein